MDFPWILYNDIVGRVVRVVSDSKRSFQRVTASSPQHQRPKIIEPHHSIFSSLLSTAMPVRLSTTFMLSI